MGAKLSSTVAPRAARGTELIFLAVFALLMVLIRIPFLDRPYHGDEVGQFVPASLHLNRNGNWVPHMVTPNVHPPGFMVYLALVDFVRLHQSAAEFVERSYPGQWDTTAWPVPIELRRPTWRRSTWLRCESSCSTRWIGTPAGTCAGRRRSRRRSWNGGSG